MSREEDREKNDAILNKFFDCIKNQDSAGISEAFMAVCKMPQCNRSDDQYYTPWKAYSMDERIFPTESNIEFHPYIRDFFDMAVREHMRWNGNLRDMKRISHPRLSADYDGSRELVAFLNNYRYLKDTLARQGKEIFRPEVFNDYSFLEDYANGVFKDSAQDISKCKNIPELVENMGAVDNYCNTFLHMYNQTEYGINIEKKYQEWCKQKRSEIYTKAENETFKQGNIADLSDEEKKFILENTKNKDRAIEVGKTMSHEVLDKLDINRVLKAEIFFAKAEKPEKLSEADKEFILKWSESEKTLKAVAKVYDFKAQSSEKLHTLLRMVENKEIRKDIAKEYIDSCKGDVTYDLPISKAFSKEEFDKAVEDYKITSYKRDNERLKAENAQMKEDVAKEWEKIRQENDKILTTKGQLRQERNEVAEETARVRAKSEEIAFIKDIDKVNKNGPDEFDTNRKKELFAKMKEEMLKNPNLREGHLAAMCKIYASATNTPEEKAAYFKDLHEVRKSGKTNTEKREMAHTFERVLERNPDLAKDESLQGLAKIDYNAVGYTPTRRGFSRNS